MTVEAMSKAEDTQPLVELGLTALEAESYAFLLRESPATGYRVAQALGKPVANTYKALESLGRKGAILVDEAESRLCRAVPADEWLSQLERQFHQRKQRASEALAGLGALPHDDRLYQLHTPSQVVERARAMLQRCRHTAVLDVFPTLLDVLGDDLEQCASRGVEVVVKTYEGVRLRGVRVVVRPRGHEITEAVPGEVISLNVDGAEHLLAVMSSETETVHQAIWTGSAIVSYLLFNGLINEVSQTAFMAELEQDTSVERLRRVFRDFRHLHPISSRGPAYQNYIRRLGGTAAGPDAGKPTDASTIERGQKSSKRSKR